MLSSRHDDCLQPFAVYMNKLSKPLVSFYIAKRKLEWWFFYDYSLYLGMYSYNPNVITEHSSYYYF